MPVDEILQLRQQPTAYMLLAYLRETKPEPYFRIQPYILARQLGRTPKTIRAAFMALMDCGFIGRAPDRGRLFEFPKACQDGTTKPEPPPDFVCSKCRVVEAPEGSRYCLPCRNAFRREWRKTHPMTPGQKKKDTARSYAGVYKRRGKLQRLPCECCGDPDSQMHHEDYDKPLDVVWLCRPCHLQLHVRETSRKDAA